MNFRIRLAEFLLDLGGFIKSLPIVIMKPDDLVEFSRRSYARPSDIESWSEDQFVDSGLTTEESNLLTYLPQDAKDLLLLGVGGGREAIPLATMGFNVTGVDYIPAMVDRAIENALSHGVEIEGLVQEISNLDVPESAFDVVWISKGMYSCIPTRRRRVEMVKRITRALRPGGLFVCQFQSNLGQTFAGRSENLRKIIASSPFGNKAYQTGDILWLNVEFVHVITSEDEIRSELEEGGLTLKKIFMHNSSIRGSALFIK